MDHNLPQYLRAVYEYVDLPLPQELDKLCALHESGAYDNLNEYTHELQDLLESLGWKRDDNYHNAWRTILLESDDCKRVVSLGLFPPASDSWVGIISFFADWPTEWSNDQKLGFLSKANYSVKPEQLTAYYGQPTITLRFDVGHLISHDFFPENIERCANWSKLRIFIERLGANRLIRGKDGWQEKLGNNIARSLNIT